MESQQNSGQTGATHTSVGRAIARLVVVTTAALALGGLTMPASEALQPPRCKVLSVSQEVRWTGAVGSKQVKLLVTTTTSRCRGKIVTTMTYQIPVNGPR